ncbi:MAG: cyclase family protein [Bdellovibrionales bacterium]|nr:cyclase family protein [Bdellovibrionales bacterium]
MSQPQTKPRDNLHRSISGSLEIGPHRYRVDFSQAFDISIGHTEGVRCFNCSGASAEPVVIKGEQGEVLFEGTVASGGNVNCYEVTISPHISGTHTEHVGHLQREFLPVGDILAEQYHVAYLVSVEPQLVNGDALLADGDKVVTRSQLESALSSLSPAPEAVIIRTLPNSLDKRTCDYSGTNPPYMHYAAADYLRELGVLHLLIDLPSADREQGELFAHRIFFQFPLDQHSLTPVPGLENVPSESRTNCTITELVYVPDNVRDGLYLLNLTAVTIPGDAAPTRPIIYPLELLES